MALRSSSASAPSTRGRVDPERKRLGLAVLMVVFGSFAPWIDTAVGPILGGRGAGLWTFYASLLGLAGALVPSRRVAGVQAAVMAVVCVVLPVWQLVRAMSMLGTEGGWLPGPGLVLVFGGGVLAGSAALRLLRSPAASQA
jgi:hypothetical protein